MPRPLLRREGARPGLPGWEGFPARADVNRFRVSFSSQAICVVGAALCTVGASSIHGLPTRCQDCHLPPVVTTRIGARHDQMSPGWGQSGPQLRTTEQGTPVSSLSSSLTEWPPPKRFHPRKPPALTMSIMDHSPTTGVVTVIVILIAIAALGALILGCWCYLRLQRISQSEDEESIVGDGETKEPFLLVQYSAKGPCVERKAKLMTPNGPEVHG